VPNNYSSLLLKDLKIIMMRAMKGLISIMLMVGLGETIMAQDTIPPPEEPVASLSQETSQQAKPEKNTM
jgi:hypothetical protein